MTTPESAKSNSEPTHGAHPEDAFPVSAPISSPGLKGSGKPSYQSPHTRGLSKEMLPHYRQHRTVRSMALFGTLLTSKHGLLLGIITVLLWFLSPANALALELTPEDRAYLDNLGEITMCVDPDWEPYELMDEQGNFTGIAADLVDIVSQRLEIPFIIVPTVDWDETLEVSRAGGCMLIPFLNQTPAREEWLTFTEPLFSNPNVFITRNEHDYISDPAELVDRTVVLPHGTSMEEFLRRDYPNLDIITVADENECYRMVSDGEADMTLRSLTMAAYTIRKDGWFNLKIAGQPPQDHYMNRLRMGVLKDMPDLRDILDKAIMTITPRERERIVNEHVNIVVEMPVDYQHLLRVVAFFSAIILLGLLWIRQTRNHNRKLHEMSLQLREDIAARERAEAQLTIHRDHLRLIIDAVPNYIFAKDVDGKFLLVNKALAKVFGVPPEEIVGKTDRDHGATEEQSAEYARADRAVIESGQPLFIAEEQAPRPDGSPGWFQTMKVPYRTPEGDRPAILGVAVDITERKQMEEELTKLAITDNLTGLSNRRMFFETLEKELGRFNRYGTAAAVITLDLDHFKTVNDTFGHAGGDQVLRSFASLLEENIRNTDMAARLGGEEFAVLLPETDLESARLTARRILEKVRECVVPLDGREIRFTVSIGLTELRSGDDYVDRPMGRADAALYKAKELGRDRMEVG